ncbi:hypothetical protein HD806DRAFT_535227 [Xylariaceae sp. AK1471]|nr:hypothetical protein HD806DRAFT_535227 [Xylariaceae sp. AK1471]
MAKESHCALSSNPSSPNQQEIGSRLTVAALVIRLVVVIFVVLAAIFYRRFAKFRTNAEAVSVPLMTLYFSIVVTLVRCICRLAEHTGNATVQLDDPASLVALSSSLQPEWYFDVFESTLMLVNSVLRNIRSPGHYPPSNYHVYLTQDSRTEIVGQEKPVDRPLVTKVASILTFSLLFRKKKADHALWELKDHPDGDRQV